MRNQRGFTLAELIIVIAVIAVILGIALPRLAGMRDEGNTVKAAAELRTEQTAVESYYLHHNKTYPNNLQGDLTGAKPQIVATDLKDPFNGGGANNYSYARSPSLVYYVIWSFGPDAVTAVTGIDNTGTVTPANRGDDIFVSNGSPSSGGT